MFNSKFCDVNDALDFANVFGEEFESICIDKMLILPSCTNYLQHLKKFSADESSCKLLHLNINSLFLKGAEVNLILELKKLYLILFKLNLNSTHQSPNHFLPIKLIEF